MKIFMKNLVFIIIIFLLLLNVLGIRNESNYYNYYIFALIILIGIFKGCYDLFKYYKIKGCNSKLRDPFF